MTDSRAPVESEPTPPPGIGPHEGRELAMMLAGAKPLAYFSELVRAEFDWPDAAFEPHVAAGVILKREFLHTEKMGGRPERIRSLYFARPGEAWRIDRAHRNRLRGYRSGTETDEDAREMGRLLGYSDEDIATFIEWRRHVRALVRTGAWTPARP